MKTENSFETEVQDVDLFSFFGIKTDQNGKGSTQKTMKKSENNKSIENKEEVVNKLINFLKTA